MHASVQVKKVLGAYYTPGPVARHVTAMAARAFFLDGGCQAPCKCLRVLDPACGNGEFLVQAIDVACEQARAGVLAPRSRVVLAGIDVNGAAVEGARARLDEAIARCRNVPVDFHVELHHADALALARGGQLRGLFDLVVGNPPYVPWSRIPTRSRQPLEAGEFLGTAFACRPRHADAQPNMYLFFILLARHFLAARGVAAYLLPQEWMHHPRAGPFRQYMLAAFDTISLVDFDPALRLFTGPRDGASTTSMILTLGSRDGHAPARAVQSIHHVSVPGKTIPDVLAVLDGDLPPGHARPPPVPASLPWTGEKGIAATLAAHVSTLDTVSLGDPRCFHVFGGFQPPVNAARSFEIDLKTKDALGDDANGVVFPVVHDARDFRRYAMPDPARFWIVINGVASGPELAISRPRVHALLASRLPGTVDGWWEFPNVRNLDTIRGAREKILCPRTAREPTFSLDRDGFVFKGTNTAITCNDPTLPATYVTGVLNSTLAGIWYGMHGPGYHGRVVHRYEPSMVRRHAIPITRPKASEALAMAAMVGEMIDAVRADDPPRQLRLQAAIDELACSIYDLPTSMRDLVERSSKGGVA